MKYLCSTRDITLTMEADERSKWWVDSSYVVHSDMRCHSGIYMTLGKGTTYSTSSKQKLNMKSSTEAELVAIDNSMRQVLWPDISLQHKANTYQLQQSTRKLRAQSYWWRTERDQAVKEPDTLTLGISLLQTKLKRAKWRSHTVPRKRC